jgi:TRAP-type C4-dicarboxylate transport system permease small subunit
VNVVREALFRIERTAAAALLATLSITIFLQVVFRYFFALPLAWSEEISRYSFIWLTMIAAPMCIRLKANLSMGALSPRLSERAAQVLEAFTCLLVLVFSAVLTVWGAALLGVVKNQTSPAIGLPMHWVYAAMPVGGLLMIIETIAQLREALQRPIREG